MNGPVTDASLLRQRAQLLAVALATGVVIVWIATGTATEASRSSADGAADASRSSAHEADSNDDDHDSDPDRAAGRDTAPLPTTVYISEVMSSNATTLATADGEHPDWIELHNPTDAPVDLAGLHLSDDDAEPAGWALPAVSLEPGDHLVVFASGRDLRDPAGELHTDFRLDRDGEPVLLATADGATVLDRIPPVALPADASYGRDPTDPTRRCFFAAPTPGAANAPECFGGPDLGAPRLSVAAGFNAEPFDLHLTTEDETLDLYYTLDGSVPDPLVNPDATRSYDGPIRIEDRTGSPLRLATMDATAAEHPYIADRPERFAMPELSNVEVEQATVVRARTAYGATTTATYWIGPDKVRDDLTVLSLVMNPAHLVGHDTGIYVAGAAFERWRDSEEYRPDVGPISIVANYNLRGREWERPFANQPFDAVVLEVCPAGGGVCTHQQRVGLRSHGRFSRAFPHRSLRLYARGMHGADRFEVPLFGPEGPTGHRSVILRNSGQDVERTMLADAFWQTLAATANATGTATTPSLAVDTQAYEPVVIFLNGEYWGVHNLRERFDTSYLVRVHGVDPARVQLLNNSGGVRRWTPMRWLTGPRWWPSS